MSEGPAWSFQPAMLTVWPSLMVAPLATDPLLAIVRVPETPGVVMEVGAVVPVVVVVVVVTGVQTNPAGQVAGAEAIGVQTMPTGQAVETGVMEDEPPFKTPRVRGPTKPVEGRPLAVWKASTAILVWEPK
jgi:hypothetical protein